MSSSSRSSLPVAGVVGFAGPRGGPAPASAVPLVSSLVSSVLGASRAVATGCASGVDSLAVSAALAAGAGPRLSVFAAFGPSGLGSLPRASASPSSFVPVVASGGSVLWWAGGGPRPGGAVPPVVGRLVRRSLAFVRSLAAAGPGSGLVLVVSGPPTRAFARRRLGAWPVWPSCGSGSWGSAGAAALLRLPVVVFPAGWPGFAPSSLPALPGPFGVWVPAAPSGLWSAGWRWSAGAGRLAPNCPLFVRSFIRRWRFCVSVSLFQEAVMNSFGKAAWLVVSPAVRRQFQARQIPVPVRVPVWLHSHERKGLRLVRLPAALAEGLGYNTPFFNVADNALRPVNSLVLHSRAAHAVRRSANC